MPKQLDSTLPYAIVIGLDCMTGLQSARILNARGIPVIGLASRADHPCCRTRACGSVYETDIGGPELIECLEQLRGRLDRPAVLFPCTDLSVLALSRMRAGIPAGFHAVMPAHDTVVALLDKIGFLAVAREQGFAVPRAFVLRNRDDAVAAAKTLRFPCAVKPAVKTPTWQARTKAKLFTVHDRTELLAIFERCADWAVDLLVQEWIPGADQNCFTCNCYLTANGKVAASFVSRKVRQWPPQTGIGCSSVEARNDHVREETIRLFENAGFHGLGYAEFKVDERSGDAFLIEPNVARPTGRSAMAEAGGVELLYTMYCDALGKRLPADRRQRHGGVKWIHLRQDLRAAWSYWRAGELTLRDWLASLRGPRTYAIFSWTDPTPFLSDLWKVARRAGGRLRRTRGRPLAWTR